MRVPVVLARGAAAAAAVGAAPRCESRRPSEALPEERWDKQVDYLVLGAGSSGCALAARLAQRLPDSRTLLIEAGTDDDIPQIQTAVDYFGKVEHVFGSERDWTFGTAAQPELADRGLYWPRGKVVGGCSSFNTMVWMRGDPADYDLWAELLADPAWSYKHLLQLFKRIESHPYADSCPRVHGADGPISVAPLDHAWHHPDDASSFVTREFIEAAVELGYARNKDFGAGTAGVGCNEVNAKAGRRCNTGAYLRMVGAYPTAGVTRTVTDSGALEVWLETQCVRVLFDRSGPTPRAVGVELVQGDRRVRVRAGKEVVLCCGAVMSPVLLMLSGVGPRDQLARFGIPLVAASPGVGQGLTDHLHVPLSYTVPGGVKLHTHTNVCEGSLFAKLRPEARSPDLQVHIGSILFNPNGFVPEGEGFTLTPTLIHPRSRGEISLTSADPLDKPLIQPNYLTDKEGYDIQQLVDGFKLVRHLGETMCARLGATEL